MTRRWAALLGLALTACAPRPPTGAPATVVWRGQVTVTRDVAPPRGVRLVIEPGTVVRFRFRDDDGDGWGDASIRVQGDLVARGTADRPVRFVPEGAPPAPGRWGEIRVDFGTVDLRYAVIEGSTRGLHAHFTRGSVADCVVRNNVDGTRLGNSVISVTRSLFYGHPGKAYNAHRCRNTVRGNRFHHNRNGIFLFEADAGSVFEANWFRANQAPFRLGDFFTGTVRVRANDWGGAPPGPRPDNPAAVLETAPAPVAASGPRGWPVWEPVWSADLGGDPAGPPLAAPEGVYAASRGGRVVLLSPADGAVLAEARLPGVARLALGPGVLAAVGPDGTVRLLGRTALRSLEGRGGPDPGPAPGGRGPVPLGGDLAAVPAPPGELHLVDRRTGLVRDAWPLGEGFLVAPGAADGRVLAATRAGRVVALDAVRRGAGSDP